MIKPYAQYDTRYFNVSGISSVVSCNSVHNGDFRFTEVAFSLFYPDYGEIDFRYVNGKSLQCTLMDRTLMRILKEELPQDVWMGIPEVRDFSEKEQI